MSFHVYLKEGSSQYDVEICLRYNVTKALLRICDHDIEVYVTVAILRICDHCIGVVFLAVKSESGDFCERLLLQHTTSPLQTGLPLRNLI